MTDSIEPATPLTEAVGTAAGTAPQNPAGRLITFFAYEHLPEGPLRDASKLCCQLAERVVDRVPDGPEKTVGLRKLLEAKDCFVRASLPTPPA